MKKKKRDNTRRFRFSSSHSYTKQTTEKYKKRGSRVVSISSLNVTNLDVVLRKLEGVQHGLTDPRGLFNREPVAPTPRGTIETHLISKSIGRHKHEARTRTLF